MRIEWIKYDMQIRRAEISDVEAIARLHYENIDQGFMSSLGLPFLMLFYSAVVAHAICFVAFEGRVHGFVAGAEDTGDFIRMFKRKYFLRAVLILMVKALNPVVLRKIIETLSYSGRLDTDMPPAELMSIVVSPDMRGSGLGRELVAVLKEEMRERGAVSMKVVVSCTIPAAMRLYEITGATPVSEIQVHKGEPSMVYVWKNIS